MWNKYKVKHKKKFEKNKKLNYIFEFALNGAHFIRSWNSYSREGSAGPIQAIFELSVSRYSLYLTTKLTLV